MKVAGEKAGRGVGGWAWGVGMRGGDKRATEGWEEVQEELDDYMVCADQCQIGTGPD